MLHRKYLFVPIVGCALLVASCGSPSSDDAEESPAPTETESAEPEAASSEADSDLVPPPSTPVCPHHEEVSEVPDEEQFELAVELGCEYGVYGEMDFEEPIRTDSDSVTLGLADPDLALTQEEMEEAGYISD